MAPPLVIEMLLFQMLTYLLRDGCGFAIRRCRGMELFFCERLAWGRLIESLRVPLDPRRTVLVDSAGLFHFFQ